MVEELRVGLFAQVIGTPRPVSEQRVYKAIDQLA
jgi:ATP-dependent helicase HrpA